MGAIRQYFKADPRAPRFRKKVFNIIDQKNKDFFSEMKKQYPELGEYTNSQIVKFITIYNRRIATEVINNRNGVRLSDGLGIIVAGACKISAKTAANNINWNSLRSVDTPVPYQNENTDNYIIKIKYSNELDKHMFKNKHMWCFDGDRVFTRTLSAEFKKPDGWKRYIVFTTRQHIAHLFRGKNKIQNTRKAEKVIKKRLDEYDEFAL